MANLRYFTWAFLFTIVGLALGAWLGYETTGNIEGAVSVFIICLVLGILEISLSFDNAIVNARILRDMTPKWQHRFLTWGIIIAVFGMRIIFPLAVVAIAAWIDPISAIRLAIFQPAEYARIIGEAHTGIAAFGGTFLMMVGMKYFFNVEKDVHWIKVLESRLSKFASVQGVEIGIVLVLILVFSRQLPQGEADTFLTAAIYGLLTFLAVEGLGEVLDATQEQMNTVHKGGLGAFIYLEVLDASFSFDGVIGAFALSTNLFVIAIGLGIGAFYVRSMTIMLVEKQTLGRYRYLEHGAFYAILVLAVIMYVQTLMHIPEVITGLIGAALILLSLISSMRYNRANPGWQEAEEDARER
ncbi:DUF475 domain-containing protein [Phyllobacterium salinisoli]|uniref:DUF475 domain-containing protein n=1 Tax=Phyllobacterium salinisoli TaxID=1899321 RepID=A0A368KCS8_9HYPH|nr:DUF475 domain-containing protein [Phyllobacterium salinisoli]RCS25890.1 DUF475 domain-containing protein [Phyllobacterium salinisoli]